MYTEEEHSELRETTAESICPCSAGGTVATAPQQPLPQMSPVSAPALQGGLHVCKQDGAPRPPRARPPPAPQLPPSEEEGSSPARGVCCAHLWAGSCWDLINALLLY